MKKLLLLISLLFMITLCRAQIRHTVTAIVVDPATHEPLELTTVALLKVSDSSLLSYTLTDKKGTFTLRNLRDNEPARLLLSHVGYQSLHINLKFTKKELLNLDTIFLERQTLTEVTIKGEVVPVVIKKDTIEFNAEAFKVRPNALVQDLLKRLPGMQVDRDGTLHYNGKDVSKVKVDGRDFFANDPKIATRNLDADMIAKIQIYDDRENDPAHLLPDYKVNKIINLKFKKKFSKSTFGHITAGAGTQDRYQVDGLYNQSINALQVSVIGNSKNLGGTEFIGTSLLGFGPTEGIQQASTAGVNINDDFGKNVKLTLAYTYGNSVYKNLQATNFAQFLGDTVLTNNSANKIHNVSPSNNITAVLQWAVDSTRQIKYEPSLSFMNNNSNTLSQFTTFNTFTPLLTRGVNNSNSNSSDMQYQHSLSYFHTYPAKGESLSINSNVQVSPNNSTGISNDELVSYTAGLVSDTLQRLANNNNSNTTVGFTAGYNYPLGKTLTATFALTTNYLSNGADLFTYDLDPKTGRYNIFLSDQSSNLTRYQWQQSGHPQLVYRKNSVELNLGFITETDQVDNQFHDNIPNLNRQYLYFFPAVSLSVGKVNFDYSEDAQQPSVNELLPATVVHNQLYSFTGNPDLKPVLRRNFNIMFNDFDMDHGMYAFISARFILETNSIIQENVVNADGVEATTPINKNGRFTTYIRGQLSKTLKKDGDWKIRAETLIDASAGRNFFEINGKDGYQDTYAFPFTETADISYKDVIDFEPSYHINPALTRYELVDYPNSRYVQQTLSVPLDVQWPKHINWSINYTYIYNPLVAQGFQRKSNLVSFSIARAFQQKDKGEIRLTCYDLFDQSVSALHFASANTINDIQNEAIRRYFLLTYSYRFAKTN